MSKFLDENGLQYFWSKLKTSLSNKVDKITGKGLSTEDYTTAEKTKLAGIDANATAVGKNVTGTSYTINGETETAGAGAEIFNDYNENKAIGEYSHAEGLGTVAYGYCSHAEGQESEAGEYSHAEGWVATASGYCAHAEGSGTTASGDFSHAEGNGTTASGNFSHAEGNGTKASSANQHAQGKYNVADSSDKYAFIIGNGTAYNARSNAFAIDWNGLIYVNNATTGVDVSSIASTIGDINTVLESLLGEEEEGE